MCIRDSLEGWAETTDPNTLRVVLTFALWSRGKWSSTKRTIAFVLDPWKDPPSQIAREMTSSVPFLVGCSVQVLNDIKTEIHKWCVLTQKRRESDLSALTAPTPGEYPEQADSPSRVREINTAACTPDNPTNRLVLDSGTQDCCNGCCIT
eukprot:TRINITY_DN20656_c0_g1_i1.p1 TRINITY_DN20656_c0_g1~~TRINITY_DN20656_c0_g1_i1.p1  ORF type:complete len:150 (+),score=17.72 TRINITY_DN20656_c0_g1_i1:129-578(+)